MAPDRRAEIEASLPTLRAEIARATEPIVREALQAKLDALEMELVELPGPTVEAVPDEPPPPPADRAKYDLEVQRLRLTINRGEKAPAEAGLKALRAEYGDQGELLEIEGDLAGGRKRWKDAEAHYAVAMSRLPGNLGVEKKHADAVFLSSGMGTLEDQLRASESSTPLLDTEVMARGGIATFLSFLFPGLGEIVLGQQVKGAAILTVWTLAVSYLAFHPNMVPGLLRQIGFGTGGDDPGGLFILCLFVAAILMLVSVFDCAAIAKRAPKITAERPRPPVDLPFE